MEDGDYKYKEAFRRMLKAKDNHRAIEEIVLDLQAELHPVKEESFLVHAMRLIMELDSKATSPLYAHLQSPMRQTLYMIDVYYSIGNREEDVEMDENRWDRIAVLLDEIEMAYFINIGFPNEGDIFHDNRDEMIDVAMSTFMGYFSNAVLSYEEQTLDRIVRFFTPYDEYIKSHYGFTVHEAIEFILHVRSLNNGKLNEIVAPYADTYSFYATHPKEWYELTQKFEERGVTDPCDWWDQPELSGMKETLTTNPGEVHLHTKEELIKAKIPRDALDRILNFFLYDKDNQKGQTVYYADKHQSESHPIIRLNEKYICPINKFLLEGMYFRIDEDLMKNEPTRKYKQNKDTVFEGKVFEIFKHFFPKGTKMFTNYSVDGISENDLLVVIGTTCIIVEIKNCGFREPFRDPIKAFPRIKRDYENAIQLGYEQCRRVESILLEGRDVDILNADNKHEVLYRLKSKSIGDIWSIVVTDFKYGVIQTDLSKLLKKDEKALYPWSVCIDDIESLFLLMKKTLKSIAPARFIEFLDYRERLQGHVLCFDELEICGWYLNDRNLFKEYADVDSLINTTPNMGTIFDAYYHVGLGFKNELDIEYKKHYALPDYPKSFDLNVITGETIREGM